MDCEDLESDRLLGIETDMLKVGVPPEGIAPLLDVVHDNLEQLQGDPTGHSHGTSET